MKNVVTKELLNS